MNPNCAFIISKKNVMQECRTTMRAKIEFFLELAQPSPLPGEEE
jgi:hypothetical protein